MKRFWILIVEKMIKFFSIIFGNWSLSWSRPKWINIVVAHKKRMYISLASMILIVGSIFTVKNYFDSLPKENYCEYQVEKPVVNNNKSDPVSVLTINFGCSAAAINQLDKKLEIHPELSYKIKGSWKWESEHRLTFTPTNDSISNNWPVGEEINIKFPKQIFSKNVLLEKYVYTLETERLEYTISNNEFYIDPINPKNKRVIATVNFNYSVNQDEFKKHVSLNYLTSKYRVLGKIGSSFGFDVKYNSNSTEAYISSDLIQVPEDDHVMVLNIEKGFHAARGGMAVKTDKEVEVNIAGKNDTFKISSLNFNFVRNEKYESEQILTVNTTIDAKSEDIAKNLKIYLLPIKNNARPSTAKSRHKDNENDQWFEGDINDKVLKNSTLVKLETLPTEHDQSKIHSFRIETIQGRYLYFVIEKGVKALEEYVLARSFSQILVVPEFEKELKIMSEGSLLSLSGEKKLAVLSRNLSEVDFKIHKIIPEQLNQAIRIMFGHDTQFARPYVYPDFLNSVNETYEEKIPITSNKTGGTDYFSLDLGKYLNKGAVKKGLFYIKLNDETLKVRDDRFILMTDLGMIVKKNVLNSYDIYIQSLSEGKPVEGVSVSVLGTNGISLFEEKTNSLGLARFPDLSQFENEKKPLAFVAQHNGDLSFIPYNISERQINFSKFDIGGQRELTSQDQMNAMVFTDRGIYRPGDKINLGLIVRSMNFHKKFENMPITWTLTDPRGLVIKSDKLFVNSFSIDDLAIQSSEKWNTGTYNFSLSILKKNIKSSQANQDEGTDIDETSNQREVIGTTAFRVEEFLPDQMKISAQFSSPATIGWVNPSDLKGNVTLKNLFGTAAENRKVEGKISVVPFQPFFDKYKDYKFVSLNKKDEVTFNSPLADQITNQAGEVNYEFDLKQFNSGMYRLGFEAKGFDANQGRSVVAISSILISPLKYLVGIKPDGSLDYILKDSKRSLDFVAINSDLKSMNNVNVNLQIVERRYVSVLTQNNNGTYAYQSVLKEISGKESKLNMKEGKGHFAIPTETVGDFTLVVRNEENIVINRIDYSVVGNGNLAHRLDKNAELHVILNKADYKVGEEIELQVNAPYVGAGLVTIERDKVYATKWFQTTTTSTVLKIKIPDELVGNAYVTVTFLRSINSKEIFTSPLSYSVIPFAINLESHRTKISLDAPPIIKPGTTLKIKYHTDKKTPLVIWGVDEGITLVARYLPPSPLKYYFQKKVHQVTTWQTLDLLLPEYSIVKELSGIGGDEGFSGLGKNLNPFKRKSNPPVVFWSHVLDSDKNPKEYSVEIPDYYNGNIKIYAVAASGHVYGDEEINTTVKGDFIVTPTAPLALTPGDEFELGLGISNQVAGSGPDAQIKVDLIESDFFKVMSPKSVSLKIAEGRESQQSFKIKTLNKLGSGKMIVQVSCCQKSSKTTFETSVRPASVFKSNLSMGVISKTTHDIPMERKMYPEFRKSHINIAHSPLAFLKGFEKFLMDYPFQCTEQLISQSVPLLFIPGEVERPELKKMMDLIGSRKTSDGGLSLYPGGMTNLFVSVYGLQFLTEAKEKGLSVPEDLMRSLIDFVKNLKIEKYTSLSDLRILANALYLEARNGIVPSHQLNFLSSYLNEKFSKQWKQDDTAIYLAGVYKILKQDEMGEKIIKNFKVGTPVGTQYELFYDSTVRDAHLMMILSKHYPQVLTKIFDSEAFSNLLNPLAEGQFNTYSAAALYYSFGSMENLANLFKNDSKESIEQYFIDGKSEKVSNRKDEKGTFLSIGENVTKLQVKSDLKIPLFFSKTESGFDRENRTKELQAGLEISRSFMNADGELLTKVKQGETVEVHLRIRATEEKSAGEVVMVDLFPGGFEYQFDPVIASQNNLNDSSSDQSAPDSGKDGGEGIQIENEGGDEGEGDVSKMRIENFLFPAAFAQVSGKKSSSVEQIIPQYVDNREDRVIVYAYVDHTLREYVYKLKAVNVGTYTVPSIFGENMYRPKIRYEGVTSKISIDNNK